MRNVRVYALLAMIALLIVSCGRSPSETTQDANDSKEIRIVSLSPAISRTLIDFELEQLIVGRTPHCASLNQTIPAVGDLLNINYEMLMRLEPTHILVQPPLAGIDPHLVDLATKYGWKTGKWHLNGIDDVETMVRQLPGVLFESKSSRFELATERAAELTNDLANSLSPLTQPVFRGRTMIVNAVNPVMAFGVNTYLHDVLIALGGSNATSGEGWVQLSFEDVIRSNPEAIILVVPGALPGADIDALAGPLMNMDIDAVSSGRMAVLSHVDAFMPSSALVQVAGELREILWSFAEGEE